MRAVEVFHILIVYNACIIFPWLYCQKVLVLIPQKKSIAEELGEFSSALNCIYYLFLIYTASRVSMKTTQ